MAGVLEEERFAFQYVPNRRFAAFESKEIKENLMKWGMVDRMSVQMFSYDKLFQPYQKDNFVKDFFQDSNVISSLKVVSSTNKWGTLGEPATSVTSDVVASSITTMEFFDRLYTAGIVRESGNIVKCYDEYLDDFIISDELRKMLLLEESDNYEVFSDTERDEFLFRIFKHLCLGGACCQYEDQVQPYLDTTKAVYKDLVSVHKDSNTKKITVGSLVCCISAKVDDVVLFPSPEEHEQSFAYLIIDPFNRHVKIWYHLWRQQTKLESSWDILYQ